MVELFPEIELHPHRKPVDDSTPEDVQVDCGGVVAQDSPVLKLKPESELHPAGNALTDLVLKPNKIKNKVNTNETDINFFIYNHYTMMYIFSNKFRR